MTKILFVCHGNICRSPMAEFIMKDLVKKTGVSTEVYIESAATSAEELGNPIYPPAIRKLAEHGIACSGKRARQLVRSDYSDYDMLIGMDNRNIINMQHICGADIDNKMHLLLDFTQRKGNIADPWYSGNFDATWRDVREGCVGLLKTLRCAKDK